MMLNYKNDAILSGFGSSFISIIMINILISVTSPSIGMLGHLGGLLGGVLLSGIFPVINRSLGLGTRIVSVAAFVVLAFLFVRIGLKSLGIS